MEYFSKIIKIKIFLNTFKMYNVYIMRIFYSVTVDTYGRVINFFKKYER